MFGTSATDLWIETAAVKRRSAANQWKRIWKGSRRAKRVNRLCKMYSEAQKLTMTGTHPVQIYGHTAQGVSIAQVNERCKNLRMGLVMGKTQACAILTDHGSSAKSECHKLPPELNKSAWITMWRCFNVDTRRRIRKVVRKKGSHFGKRHQTLEPSYRSNLCHHLLGVGGGLEAEHTRFLANASRQMARCSTRRRSSTVSPGIWKCKHGKERLGIRSVRAF